MSHGRFSKPGWRVLVVGLSLGRAVWAAPGHSYGFGSRATALGGAVSADSPDASAVFYNPAGLVLAPTSQLSLGYRATALALASNGQAAEIPGLSTLEGGIVGRGRLGEIEAAFGLALSLSNGHLSRSRSVSESKPHWVLRETLPELFDVASELALQPWRHVSVGAGLGFLAATRGAFEVGGTALFSDGQGSEYDSRLRHAVDADLLSVRYPLLGLTIEPALLRLGRGAFAWRSWLALSYRGEAKLEQRLSGELDGDIDAGLLRIPVRYSFDSRSLIAFQPREVVLGASFQRLRWHANVDVGWQQWSRYPSPVARSGSRVEADVPAGLPISLPPSTDLPSARSAGFLDRLTLRVGVEHRVGLQPRAALALRAGYAFLPSPAPTQPLAGRFLDADEHVLSAGIGLELDQLARLLPSALRVDAHGLWGYLPERQLRAPEEISASGSAWQAGATLGLGFR